MSKVEGGGGPIGSCSYFFFEASRVKALLLIYPYGYQSHFGHFLWFQTEQ